MALHLHGYIHNKLYFNLTCICVRHNTQLQQKQLKHKMAFTKNWATIVYVPHSTQF
jgi:hypothetical protein